MTQPSDPGFDQVRANAVTPPTAEFAQATPPAADMPTGSRELRPWHRACTSIR